LKRRNKYCKSRISAIGDPDSCSLNTLYVKTVFCQGLGFASMMPRILQAALLVTQIPRFGRIEPKRGAPRRTAPRSPCVARVAPPTGARVVRPRDGGSKRCVWRFTSYTSQILDSVVVMIIVISPAKKLDFITPIASAGSTTPNFIEQSAQLIAVLRQYAPIQLASLMHLSDELASLNVAVCPVVR
jgi:hypothetical protein